METNPSTARKITTPAPNEIKKVVFVNGKIVNASTARSDKRREELTEAAKRNGFVSWSAMLTAIKNGTTSVIWSAEEILKKEG